MMHEAFIESLAKHLKPKIYVELGVHHCANFNKVLSYISAWAYAVDINEESGKRMNSGLKRSFHLMNTEEFYTLWEEDIRVDIDMIFIDADHSKDAVLKDVENFFWWLKRDTGIMVLHDTWPLNKSQTRPGYSGDCYKVPAILKHNYPDEMELLTLPVPYGLTLIRRVGDDWRNG